MTMPQTPFDREHVSATVAATGDEVLMRCESVYSIASPITDGRIMNVTTFVAARDLRDLIEVLELAETEVCAREVADALTFYADSELVSNPAEEVA